MQSTANQVCASSRVFIWSLTWVLQGVMVARAVHIASVRLDMFLCVGNHTTQIRPTCSSVTVLERLADTAAEFGLTCEYIRERKKRGKASRKDLAQQQVAAAVSQLHDDTDTAISSDPVAERTQSNSPSLTESQRPLPPGHSTIQPTPKLEIDSESMYQGHYISISAAEAVPEPQIHDCMGIPVVHSMKPSQVQKQGSLMHEPIPEYNSMNEYSQITSYPLQPRSLPLEMAPGMQPLVCTHGHRLEYPDSPYGILSPHRAHEQAVLASYRILEESPRTCHVADSSDLGSPEWLLPSPSATMYPDALQHNFTQQLRFPVLQPLIPHLVNIVPIALACDLLELYFQSSSSTLMQPVSPYVLGYVFRKSSFLRQKNPRVCSPALLASILWIGCLTSESPYLSSSPFARSQVSEKLINLTISLLKPSVQQTPAESNGCPTTYSHTNVSNGVDMERTFGMPTQESETGRGEFSVQADKCLRFADFRL